MEQGDPGQRLAALAQRLPGLSGQQLHTNCTHTGLILTQLYTTAANTHKSLIVVHGVHTYRTRKLKHMVSVYHGLFKGS